MKTIAHALVTSHLDNCNSVLFGIPKYQTDRLQKVLNTAARLIFGIPKVDHISSTLFHLHLLPVANRVQFKLLLSVHKAADNQAPEYIKELLLPQSNSAYHPPSCDRGFLTVTKTTP